MRSPSWQAQRKCQELSPQEADEIFFPTGGGKKNRAAKYCADCPVAMLCLDEAITEGLVGMWSGTSDKDRQQIAKLQNLVIRTMSQTIEYSLPANNNFPTGRRPKQKIRHDTIFDIEGPTPEEEALMVLMG